MNPTDYGIVQSISYKFVDFDFYSYPEGEWDKCPFCGQKPQVSSFDNGRCTACGCLLVKWNKYRHFAIHAESIMSVYKRTGSAVEYDFDELRKNWNHFCRTGEELFQKPIGGRDDGRW